MSSQHTWDMPPTPPPENEVQFIMPPGIKDLSVRVGGPYLCPLPAETCEITERDDYSALFYHYHHEMSLKVADLLNIRGVDYESIRLCTRKSIEVPVPDPIPTIFITARDRPPGDLSWVLAANDILNFLGSFQVYGACVEISDISLVAPDEEEAPAPEEEAEEEIVEEVIPRREAQDTRLEPSSWEWVYLYWPYDIPVFDYDYLALGGFGAMGLYEPPFAASQLQPLFFDPSFEDPEMYTLWWI
ncbi:hypothetical protein P175DRAFT_0530707 [Aspergillus ochraceoroseus IBT 24754]|uniref:Uncharacterized protein n=1 Tax=Aspergillus ochraceoroseus IBT 24754 TaxID=1392256 RepID=A0A2T5M4V2_9EURO|nr:uncharacterized protein P175DRAFT_0530707 [Aspergillus ochraceoroseus IBT 24754]PTU23578.1 hypothetical protein P175DRAFT_0530707 [Aspergillus ochraceoroseus IBT 24754]